jgi:hypothetical protein
VQRVGSPGHAPAAAFPQHAQLDVPRQRTDVRDVGRDGRGRRRATVDVLDQGGPFDGQRVHAEALAELVVVRDEAVRRGAHERHHRVVVARRPRPEVGIDGRLRCIGGVAADGLVALERPPADGDDRDDDQDGGDARQCLSHAVSPARSATTVARSQAVGAADALGPAGGGPA